MVGHDELQEAFETQGYDVTNVTENRDRVNVSIREADAAADELREIVHDVVGDGVLGLKVTNESVDGGEVLGTVVSFRSRA
ncbi:hypothetical protein ACYJ1Y_06745 [Natrialbaceae archaeon A-gly3]